MHTNPFFSSTRMDPMSWGSVAGTRSWRSVWMRWGSHRGHSGYISVHTTTLPRWCHPLIPPCTLTSSCPHDPAPGVRWPILALQPSVLYFRRKNSDKKNISPFIECLDRAAARNSRRPDEDSYGPQLPVSKDRADPGPHLPVLPRLPSLLQVAPPRPTPTPTPPTSPSSRRCST